MRKSNVTIVEELKKFLEEVSRQPPLYRRRPEDFTRERKLSFQGLVLFLINLSKKSLGVELSHYFQLLGKKVGSGCSKSAFSQSRQKLEGKFFQDWNGVLIQEYYTGNDERVKRWEGFRLQVVDGSTLYLVDTPAVREFYGVHNNQKTEVPMGRIVWGYDPLNELVLWSELNAYATSETPVAIQHLKDTAEDIVSLYDRGFPWFALLYESVRLGKHFVVRCPLKWNKAVEAFVDSDQESALVEWNANWKARRYLSGQGKNLAPETRIRVRLVKVRLPTGALEILATSLYDERRYPTQTFGNLYALRWGTETFADRLKNKLQVEIFSGHRPETIPQDFYAMMFVANLQSLLCSAGEEELKKVNPRRKYTYQINRNVSLGLMKDRLVELFLSAQPEEILQQLQQEFSQHLEPVRPGRSFPRSKEKHRRLTGKYQTQTNYRRAV